MSSNSKDVDCQSVEVSEAKGGGGTDRLSWRGGNRKSRRRGSSRGKIDLNKSGDGDPGRAAVENSFYY